MKKILAIAISLVMVFAVAASAMALFGFKPNETPIILDKFVVDVSIYDDEFPVSAGATSLIKGFYPVHNPVAGVRAGDPVIALVTLTVPDFDALSAEGKAILDGSSWAGLASMNIVCSNVTDWSVTPPSALTGTALGFDDDADLKALGTDARTPMAAYKESVTAINGWATNDIPISAGQDGTTLGWLLTGRITSLADATISAMFGVDDPAVGLGTGETTCMIGQWAVIKDAAVATLYTMEEYSTAGTLLDNRVFFAVAAPDNAGNQRILSTYVSPDDGTTNYLVSEAFDTHEIQFHNQVTAAVVDKVAEPEVYSQLLGILTRAMTAMGFTWEPDGRLYDEGFEALAAVGLQFSDSETYYAYTAALTVAGTAVVPDTGDNTVVGIVMMAVAVLATAAIVIKKVRA